MNVIHCWKSKSNDHMPFFTNDNLVFFYIILSYTHTSVCLVMLLIQGLFNLRLESNCYNLHKLDKVTCLRARPHIASNYTPTLPN